jgi:CheY-like chemotaxis protein
VRSHRGAVRVESRPGEGSVFTVYFPAAPAAEKASESPAVAPPAEAGTGLVLVVDDEDDVRTVVSAMLRRHGYQVQTAASGGEGLRLLRELHGRVSLVLLDMSMPDMNGEEVASAMQRQGETVPVLLSSGFSEADVDRRLAQVAFAGFIQKPYAMQALLDKVRDVLRRPPQP